MPPKTTGTVSAGPTKAFFVEMLTRDIDLADAILDLLDNCIDGVVRQNKGKKNLSKPFAGRWAKIDISPKSFQITDNCGGIPKKIAEKSAFMLGRPDLKRDSDVETVGMYGIGMKRAIFKIGRNCVVTSQSNGEPYQVTISPKWFQEDSNWELPLEPANFPLEEAGTRIKITSILKPIASKFDAENSTFIDALRKEIAQLFAITIQKGFLIYVNDEEVRPIELKLLSQSKITGTRGIAPYIFRGTIKKVSVNLVFGFYRPLATETELQDEAEQKRSRNHAGWTVVCNDRIVLYADRSRVTGWGTSDVPSYHNQFISIGGIVSFRSKDSFALPLNTTKRGLDTSSEVYLYVLDYMREGMKLFTNFTNKWKTHEDETGLAFSKLEKMKFSEIVTSVDASQWKQVRRGGTEVVAKRFIPDLPKPVVKESLRKISFSRPLEHIDLVSQHLNLEADTKPSDVGAHCFDLFFEETQQ